MPLLSPDFYEGDAVIDPVSVMIRNPVNEAQIDLILQSFMDEGAIAYDRELEVEKFQFAGVTRWFTNADFAAFLSTLPALLHPDTATRRRYDVTFQRCYATQYSPHAFAVLIHVTPQRKPALTH